MAAALLVGALSPSVADTPRPVPRPQSDAAAPDEPRTGEAGPAAVESGVAPTASPAEAAPAGPVQGPVTGLPMPRFVSTKAERANIRRGPSRSHRIDWVFQHRGMPLMVVGEYGHWRQVRDRDGLGGWVHYALLSSTRTVVVDAEMAVLRARPDPQSRPRARLERDVVGRLDECRDGWCRVDAAGFRGWVARASLWGVDLGATPAPRG